MALTVFFLLVGFALLIKGADFLVKGSASLARKFNVSELVIGLTIVAFGTSAPELVVSIVSSAKGLNEVVFGNVIGSNIFNLFLILGVSGIIYPIVVQKSTIKKEIPYSLLAVIVLYLLVNDDLLWGKTNYFSLFDALILLFFFALFLIYIFNNLKNEPGKVVSTEKTYSLWVMLLMIAGGLAGLVFGGQMVVDNAVVIARSFHLSDKLIGLTIIAAGTSLPELATSAVAAFRKNSDISIGNIIGSNIFNILFVLTVSGIISPMDYNASLNIDLYVLIGGTVLLFILFLGKSSKLNRWEAFLLLIGYFVYLFYLIWRQ